MIFIDSLSPTAKRWVEWPLIVVLIWVFQIFEISIFPRVGNLQLVHVVPLVVCYAAYTRGWGLAAFLALALSFFDSPTIGFNAWAYLAIQLWTALAMKAAVVAFNIEGRNSFAGLVAANRFVEKLVTFFVMQWMGVSIGVGHIVVSGTVSALISMGLAYLCFPLFVGWDRGFDHDLTDKADLNSLTVRKR